jgi:hypothetical protein
LDINQPQDLLRALLNAITEYDAKEEGDNKPSKMVKMAGFVNCHGTDINIAYQVQQRKEPKERRLRACGILS